LQTTFLAAMPAAGAAQAIAPNSEQTQVSDESSDFARVLSDCGSTRQAPAEKSGEDRGIDGKNGTSQDEQENRTTEQEQMLLLLACPVGVFAPAASESAALSGTGSSGAEGTAAIGDAAVTAEGASQGAPRYFAGVREGSAVQTDGAEALQSGGVQNQQAEPPAAAQEPANYEAEQALPQQYAAVTGKAGRNDSAPSMPQAVALEAVPVGDRAPAVVSPGAAADPGGSENADLDGSGSAALDSDAYALAQGGAAPAEESGIAGGQSFENLVKIQPDQTDNQSVDAWIQPEAPRAQAAAADTAPAEPVRENSVQRSVFEQVFERVSEIQVDGENHVTFALKPDSLGSIRIMVEGSGPELAVTIETDNQEVRDALSESLGQLASSLGVQNMKQDQIRVVFTEQQDFVQDGMLASGDGSAEERHGLFARQTAYEAEQDPADNGPGQMQVFIRASRFNQYA